MPGPCATAAQPWPMRLGVASLEGLESARREQRAKLDINKLKIGGGT